MNKVLRLLFPAIFRDLEADYQYTLGKLQEELVRTQKELEAMRRPGAYDPLEKFRK